MSCGRNGRARPGAVAALLAAAALSGCEKAQVKAPPPKPTEVLYKTPVQSEVTDFEDFTGRTAPFKSVDIRARVTGYLAKILFKDGDDVKEGDVLFEIDRRPYQAELDRTESALAQAEARLKRTEADFRRATTTIVKGAISRQEFDLAAGDYNEARAAVGTARAQRDIAQLNLEFTRVVAPLSGRISRRMSDVGNLVKADDTILTNIVALDPIYVNFDIDERTLLRLRRLIKEGKVRTRAEGEVPVQAALADEDGYPHQGAIDFAENKVDPNTGTLQIRAVMENPITRPPNTRVLSPGLFVRIHLPIGSPHRALMVPEQAVGTDQGRKFLYLINDKNEVVYRPVKVGALEKGMRVIEDGLDPSAKVIVSGLQRVRPGKPVVPKPAEQYAADARPEAGEKVARSKAEGPGPSGG